MLQLPDSLEDFLNTIITAPSQMSPLFTHCKRELMHQIWQLLLDEEFLHAYKHGIVLCCADGVVRRIYPRIFTYSADYPEKCVHNNNNLLSLVLILYTGYFWLLYVIMGCVPAQDA